MTLNQDRQFYRGRDPGRAVSIEDLRAMAHRRLPYFVREYIEGGAEDEVTLCRNREVFNRYTFHPRILSGVTAPKLATEQFGLPTALPLAIAPTGFAGLLWRDGDIALARAAKRIGVPFIQSTASNSSIESVTASAGQAPWFQLYVFRSRDIVQKLVQRALGAGSKTLVVTVDATIYGNREWDRRNYRIGTNLTFRNKMDALLHPRWLADIIRGGVPGFANMDDFLPVKQRDFASAARWMREGIDQTLDWEALSWVRSLWTGALVLKGVATVEDAERAAAIGVDGIVLSNHGGRQLDSAQSPLSILAQVAAKLNGRTKLYIDSGFRRGNDIIKALALGADGVLIGRAALYGLAASGEAGVLRALTIFQEEMSRTLAILGINSLENLKNHRFMSPDF